MDSEVRDIVAAVRQQAGEAPFEVAIILGSGLGGLAEQAEACAVLPYRDFPCFPAGEVAGHTGQLVAGVLQGRRTLLFQGRQHLYQGYSARQVTVPVRIAHALGCRKLLLTNASGGVNETFAPGDFMLISDHLNFLGDNPLRGERRDPFVDLSDLYQTSFFPELQQFAARCGCTLHRGVLAALSGPSYETPAEIRALRLLGADVVSMSTVPEAIMARYLRLEVVGLTLIANAAAGCTAAPLSHEEVLDAGRRGAAHFAQLVLQLLSLWEDSRGTRGV